MNPRSGRSAPPVCWEDTKKFLLGARSHLGDSEAIIRSSDAVWHYVTMVMPPTDLFTLDEYFSKPETAAALRRVAESIKNTVTETGVMIEDAIPRNPTYFDTMRSQYPDVLQKSFLPYALSLDFFFDNKDANGIPLFDNSDVNTYFAALVSLISLLAYCLVRLEYLNVTNYHREVERIYNSSHPSEIYSALFAIEIATIISVGGYVGGFNREDGTNHGKNPDFVFRKTPHTFLGEAKRMYPEARRNTITKIKKVIKKAWNQIEDRRTRAFDVPGLVFIYIPEVIGRFDVLETEFHKHKSSFIKYLAKKRSLSSVLFLQRATTVNQDGNALVFSSDIRALRLDNPACTYPQSSDLNNAVAGVFGSPKVI